MEIKEEIRHGKTIYELPLRVCYYARVSTDHEVQATSIVNQVDYFVQYIRGISGWKNLGGYVDEGISGKDVKARTDFMRMIDDAKKGKFDLILTKSVSRFARNTIDSIFFTNMLLQYGVGVFFLNDNINTFYGDSEFRLTLMASIAQDELRKLSESVQFGLQQSIQRGVVLGNDNILGYRKKRGRLEIVENEARIVRDVFAWFSLGRYTYREVGEMVDSKYGKHLDSTGIRRVLTNYKYKGYYCGGKSRVTDYKSSKRKNIDSMNWVIYRAYDLVPPIVSEEVWDRVQRVIARKRKRGGKYQGKLYCVRHGKYLKYKKNTYGEVVYQYYICTHCCSFSSSLLDRIYRYVPFDRGKVLVGSDDIRLDLYFCE